MTLLWSPESIHDLLALRAHINEHDPAAAKRVALHILFCVEYLLAENPKLGAPGRAPGTPAARDLLARPRRFERPTFALGAFTHSPIEQYPAISRALPLAGVWSIEAHRRP
jgi:plasmid stabilization system protein ParE